MEMFKTAVYSVECLKDKPIASPLDVIKSKAANYKYGCCTTFIIDGKPACCCAAKKFADMKVTESTFEATECGAVETGCATVDGKKYCMMRIWDYCCCSYDYYCEYVIMHECHEAAPAKEAEPKKEEEEEEEEDLFGDDDDDEDDEAAEAMQEKLRAEAEKKKKEANKKVEKSLLVIHIKPFDEETDLKALFEKIRGTEVKGCKWGETCNIKPLAFGINFLEISCVIEDDVCSEDDVIDAITQFEDEVQSTETVSFNKIS